MATGRTRKTLKVEPGESSGVVTLSVPVAKLRNRLAADPLLRKSAAHTDKRKRQRRNGSAEARLDIVDTLNKRDNDKE